MTTRGNNTTMTNIAQYVVIFLNSVIYDNPMSKSLVGFVFYENLRHKMLCVYHLSIMTK